MPDCKCLIRDGFPALLVNHRYSWLGAAIFAIAASFGRLRASMPRQMGHCKEATAVLRAVEPTRPNVIVILTDDQGTANFVIAGENDLATPLSTVSPGTALRFTQSYAAASVSPSRHRAIDGSPPRPCRYAE